MPPFLTWSRTSFSAVDAGDTALALQRGERDILENLTKQFESTLITQALQHTGGRRIEAATLLGMGRNTLTRKIQELGLDEGKEG